jgi:hypothetical protein
MPCYEVRTVQVEFKAKSREILLKALVDAKVYHSVEGNTVFGSGWEIDLDKQTATVGEGYESRLNKVRRLYSEAVVSEVAKRKKWLVKKLADNKMQLKRF